MKSRSVERDFPSLKLLHLGYEELREHVIVYGESFISKPFGITVFYRLGMAGWLDECRKLPRLTFNDNRNNINNKPLEVTEMVQPGSREQVVDLLSNMILAISDGKVMVHPSCVF